MKKIYIFILGILVIVFFAAQFLYITQSGALASESLEAEELKARISRIYEQNQIIESEILSYSSLLTIASRAAEMGFEKPSEVISLNRQESIALKH